MKRSANRALRDPVLDRDPRRGVYRPRHRCRLNNVFDTKSQLCAARIKRGREERERERLRGTREKGTCYFRRGSKPRRDYTLSHTVLFRPLSLSLSLHPTILSSLTASRARGPFKGETRTRMAFWPAIRRLIRAIIIARRFALVA